MSAALGLAVVVVGVVVDVEMEVVVVVVLVLMPDLVDDPQAARTPTKNKTAAIAATF